MLLQKYDSNGIETQKKQISKEKLELKFTI